MSSESATVEQCCDCTTNKPLPESLRFRFQILGAVTAIIAGINFGLGMTFYYHVDLMAGAWYIAVVSFPAYIACFFPNNRGTAIAIAVFSILGFMAGIVGSAVDGYNVGVIKSFNMCQNADKNTWTYGSYDDNAVRILSYCYTKNVAPPKSTDLVCVRRTDSSVESGSCWYINGVKDANKLKGFYMDVLEACLVTDTILTILLLILFAVTCDALCNTKKYQTEVAKKEASEFTSPVAPVEPVEV